MWRVAATIAIGAVALAPSAGADSTTVIRLISTFQHADVIVDGEPEGAADAGDVIVSVNRLKNATAQFGRPKSALVGHDRGRFTFVSPTRMHLDGWTTLPGGRIHVRGLVRKVRGEIVAMRVVGGTGAFAGARGTVTVTPYPTTARTLVVYRLRLK